MILGLTEEIIGDNWDKNILPSYRTSDRKTLSLHLFHVYAILDRVSPTPHSSHSLAPHEIELATFIPSVQEQEKLMKELTFLFSSSIVANHPQLEKQFGNIYPKHLEHRYSYCAGNKTKQVSHCLKSFLSKLFFVKLKYINILPVIYFSNVD